MEINYSIIALQLWRVSDSEFQFRTSQEQFLTCDGEGSSVSAVAGSPSINETFYVERNYDNRVHIKLKNGNYLQVYSIIYFIILEFNLLDFVGWTIMV